MLMMVPRLAVLALFSMALFVQSAVGMFTDLPDSKVRAIPAGQVGPVFDTTAGFVVSLVEGSGLKGENSLFIVNSAFNHALVLWTKKDQFILFDAPDAFLTFSPSGEVTDNALLRGLRSISAKALVQVLVYSHSHADHIGAAQDVMASDLASPRLQLWSSAATARKLKQLQDPRRPIPRRFVEKGFTYVNRKRFPGVKFTMQSRSYHEEGNLLIDFSPMGLKTMMLVDSVFQGMSPFFELALAENAQAYFIGLDEILDSGMDNLITGHWNKPSTRVDVQLLRDYISAILTSVLTHFDESFYADVGASMGKGFFDPDSKFHQNSYVLFNDGFSKIAKACEREVNAQFVDRLGGADLQTQSHCEFVLLRINPGEITRPFIKRYVAGESMVDEYLNAYKEPLKGKTYGKKMH